MAEPGNHQPYSLSMDSDRARELFKDGGVLLLLDAPDNLAFGIDQQVFLAGPKFKGVKMIPPGTHAITTTTIAVDKCMPTVTQWMTIRARSVYVARWESSLGRFLPLTDEDEAGRYALGVKRYDFDSELAPYPLHSFASWQVLTHFIDSGMLDALRPPSGFVEIVAEARDLALMTPRTAAERRLLEQLRKGREAFADRAGAAHDAAAPCDAESSPMESDSVPADSDTSNDNAGRSRYTRIPHVVRQAGATAQVLTAMNMDKTPLLRKLFLDRYPDGHKRVLAELQYAFVTFLIGKSLEGFLHWKALLTLLFSCDEAATQTDAGLYVSLLQVVSAQLRLALQSDATATAAATAASGSGQAMDTVDVGESLHDFLGDSFLRQQALSFLEVIIEERDSIPAALWHQAVQTKQLHQDPPLVNVQSELFRTLLRDALGWDVMSELEDVDGPAVVDLSELSF